MIESLGRYEIFEKLGEGGFAIVYKGRDAALDRLVALKELRPLLLKDRDWIKRFQREARTIARLDHPNIVPIYDVYEADERLFIVMRLVDGLSLEDWLAEHGRLAWVDVMTVMSAITAGLTYAHGLGILHRDIKPANILIDPERGPMLSDFGLAKIVGEHSMSMTDSGSIVGTPHYIAPEVWEGKGTTAQSDIYALGCVLYETITGEKIFKGETPPAVMMAHFKPLVLPDTWPEGTPSGIGEVLETALAQKPEERYDSTHQMMTALAALSSVQPGTPQIAAPAPLATSQMTAMAGSGDRHQAPASSRSAASAETLGPQEAVAPDVEAKPSTPSPAVITPQLTAPTTRKEHVRRGCFWKGVVTMLVLVVALVIGTGSFCAAFGSSLGSSIGSPVDAVAGIFSRNVQIGQTVTEPINIPVPDSAETTRLELEIAAGQLTLAPGAEDALLAGEATYNVPELKPEVTISGSTIRLNHEGQVSNSLMLALYDLINNDLENSWDLRLSDSPMALSVSIGTAEALIELGGTSLADLSIIQGAVSELDLSFAEPNQIPMQTFDFGAGPIRRATLSGLANSRANNINIKASGGEFVLEFSGQQQNDMNVTLSGPNGIVTIIVPDGPTARVQIDSRDVQVDAPPAWQQERPGYIKPGADYTIAIAVNLESGNIKLRTP